MIQDSLGASSPRIVNRRRVPFAAQELLSMGHAALTATEIHTDWVDSVDIDHEEVHVTSLRTAANHVVVTKLHNEAETLQGNVLKEIPIPFLLNHCH